MTIFKYFNRSQVSDTHSLNLIYSKYCVKRFVFTVFNWVVELFVDLANCYYLSFYNFLANSSASNDLTKTTIFSPFLKTKILHSHVWSLVFLFLTFYVVMIFSIIMCLMPLIFSFTNCKFKNTINYIHISPLTLYKFTSTPLLVIFLITLTWFSLTSNMWFGHVTMSTLQKNITLLCLLTFGLVCYVYNTTLIYNTKDVYDFTTVLFNTCVWIFFLFYSNNFFTVVFFIEILTGLTTLFLITSSFSSTYNYKLWDFSKSIYFSSILPKNTLDTLIFFFWMSLISSLLLFIFIIFFYIHLYTFEFSLVEVLTSHVLNTSTFKQFLTTITVSTILIVVIFLKCGLVPLYIWKPVVFKGMTLHVIFFYICYYYYYLLTFFIYFFIIYCHNILWESKIIFTVLVSFLLIGMIVLFFIILESHYFKSFLAMSSILNTLLIFLGMSSLSTSNFFLLI